MCWKDVLIQFFASIRAGSLQLNENSQERSYSAADFDKIPSGGCRVVRTSFASLNASIEATMKLSSGV